MHGARFVSERWSKGDGDESAQETTGLVVLLAPSSRIGPGVIAWDDRTFAFAGPFGLWRDTSGLVMNDGQLCFSVMWYRPAFGFPGADVLVAYRFDGTGVTATPVCAEDPGTMGMEGLVVWPHSDASKIFSGGLVVDHLNERRMTFWREWDLGGPRSSRLCLSWGAPPGEADLKRVHVIPLLSDRGGLRQVPCAFGEDTLMVIREETGFAEGASSRVFGGTIASLTGPAVPLAGAEGARGRLSIDVLTLDAVGDFCSRRYTGFRNAPTLVDAANNPADLGSPRIVRSELLDDGRTVEIVSVHDLVMVRSVANYDHHVWSVETSGAEMLSERARASDAKLVDVIRSDQSWWLLYEEPSAVVAERVGF